MFAQCINLYQAQHRAVAVLTPVGEATVAARRLAALLTDLHPQDRQDILGQVVAMAAAGPEGCGFSLMVSHEPTTDPEA
jgi:hypothetical protein